MFLANLITLVSREDPQNRLAKIGTPLSPYKVAEGPPAVQVQPEDPPQEPPGTVCFYNHRTMGYVFVSVFNLSQAAVIAGFNKNLI